MPPCKVYLVDCVQIPRNHQSIFVEVTTDGSGQTYQVIGTVAHGMAYESKYERRPEDSGNFATKRLQGTVEAADLDAFDRVCKGVSPPPMQYANGEKINPRVPDRDCQDWVRDALQALRDAGLIKTATVTNSRQTNR